MQQLFAITKFRHAILSINDSKSPDKSYELTDDDNILHQTQKLFTYMLFSYYGDLNPKNFIFSLKFYGERINPRHNPRQSFDSSEFFLIFCDLIEKSLENTKYKSLIKDIFCGKTKEKRICSICNNSTFTEEEFREISLDIKDMKDIYESLNKFISEEIIEDYKCDKCNNKVNLKKITFFSSLPNVLVIHLKRIIINNKGEHEQISSKFDFPIKELNIKKYCSLSNKEQNDEFYKYNLKGINIFKGRNNVGNYVCLIKNGEDKWYLFDGSLVKEI